MVGAVRKPSMTERNGLPLHPLQFACWLCLFFLCSMFRQCQTISNGHRRACWLGTCCYLTSKVSRPSFCEASLHQWDYTTSLMAYEDDTCTCLLANLIIDPDTKIVERLGVDSSCFHIEWASLRCQNGGRKNSLDPGPLATSKWSCDTPCCPQVTWNWSATATLWRSRLPTCHLQGCQQCWQKKRLCWRDGPSPVKRQNPGETRGLSRHLAHLVPPRRIRRKALFTPPASAKSLQSQCEAMWSNVKATRKNTRKVPGTKQLEDSL